MDTMDTILGLLCLASLGGWLFRILKPPRQNDRLMIQRRAREVGLLVEQHYLVQACPRCHECDMQILSVSPNGRSVHYECRHCQKKQYAQAGSQEALAAGRLQSELEALLENFARRYSQDISIGIAFCAPQSPLPFEQTTREAIPEAVRSEIWRRDGGRCAQCGSQQNIEFDHIIPVSRGGATSVRNLQLLCKQCNRQKGASI